MTLRCILTTFRTSILATSIAISASSLAIAQQSEANSDDQRDTTAHDGHQDQASTAGQIDCSNPPDSIGQRVIENAQPGNPNAPADIQGTRGQRNPSTERIQNAQISEYDDNCLDEHERPSNTEAVRDQENPGGVQPEPREE